MARRVGVATVAQLDRGCPTVKENVDRVCTLAEYAATSSPDIICLPEAFAKLGLRYERASDIAEPVPGPTVDRIASLAKRYSVWMVCPLLALHGNSVMNDAVLLDRAGRIAGVYSKLHPVTSDAEYTALEKGVVPGDRASVFQTDFGSVGVQICFDISYLDGWDDLAAQGAEILFWPSAYDGGKHLSVLAWNVHRYLVSSVRTFHSRIIDPMGEVLALTGPRDPVAFRRINLDVGVFHTDYNAPRIADIRRKYGSRVSVTVWNEEVLFTLASEDESLTVPQLVEEFGLEPLASYLRKNLEMRNAARPGVQPGALPSPYPGRSKYVDPVSVLQPSQRTPG